MVESQLKKVLNRMPPFLDTLFHNPRTRSSSGSVFDSWGTPSTATLSKLVAFTSGKCSRNLNRPSATASQASGSQTHLLRRLSSQRIKEYGKRRDIVAWKSAKLDIIWRNPQPVQRRQRWEALKVGSNSSLYVIQEFLSTGEYGFWNTTCRLQVFSDCG